MTLTEKRQEILVQSALIREAEVLQYQINIDNYRLAIKEIDDNYGEEMQDFRNRLSHLLETAILEQTKEKIMLKVIKTQLGE